MKSKKLTNQESPYSNPLSAEEQQRSPDCTQPSSVTRCEGEPETQEGKRQHETYSILNRIEQVTGIRLPQEQQSQLSDEELRQASSNVRAVRSKLESFEKDIRVGLPTLQDEYRLNIDTEEIFNYFLAMPFKTLLRMNEAEYRELRHSYLEERKRQYMRPAPTNSLLSPQKPFHQQKNQQVNKDFTENTRLPQGSIAVAYYFGAQTGETLRITSRNAQRIAEKHGYVSKTSGKSLMQEAVKAQDNKWRSRFTNEDPTVLKRREERLNEAIDFLAANEFWGAHEDATRELTTFREEQNKLKGKITTFF